MHTFLVTLSDITFLVWMKYMILTGFIVGFIVSIIDTKMFDLVYGCMDGTRYAITFAFYTLLGYFFYLYVPSILLPFCLMVLSLIFFTRLENRYGYFESIDKKYKIMERLSNFTFSFKISFNIGK